MPCGESTGELYNSSSSGSSSVLRLLPEHYAEMQVAELLVGVPAPIMYWEQGHEWLFGDPVRFQVCIHCSTMLSTADTEDGHSQDANCGCSVVHTC